MQDPSRNARVTSATFEGLRGNRPRFDIGDQHAPMWLVRLVESGKVKGGEFIVNGKPLPVGAVVTGSD